ncbi:hypothetical protein H6G00_19075 [Leptolyngbya sp. FACHB-541]|nr:hypothetical protein [Leptolyngbya sp. FACHB-541]MBD1998704.1 hypothetical protein [Leptolyngbya sp. FACHB-541]
MLPMLLMMNASALIEPLRPWSLWVPLLFLNLIVIAAVYFVRIRIR